VAARDAVLSLESSNCSNVPPVRIQQAPCSPAPVRTACNRLGRLGEWNTRRNQTGPLGRQLRLRPFTHARGSRRNIRRSGRLKVTQEGDRSARHIGPLCRHWAPNFGKSATSATRGLPRDQVPVRAALSSPQALPGYQQPAEPRAQEEARRREEEEAKLNGPCAQGPARYQDQVLSPSALKSRLTRSAKGMAALSGRVRQWKRRLGRPPRPWERMEAATV
jgi:hypothetical protein